jgi:hypothetical protein
MWRKVVTPRPAEQPVAQAFPRPTQQPTQQAARQPTQQAARQPTKRPTQQPTQQAARQPTKQAARQPTQQAPRQPSQQQEALTQLLLLRPRRTLSLAGRLSFWARTSRGSTTRAACFFQHVSATTWLRAS